MLDKGETGYNEFKDKHTFECCCCGVVAACFQKVVYWFKTWRILWLHIIIIEYILLDIIICNDLLFIYLSMLHNIMIFRFVKITSYYIRDHKFNLARNYFVSHLIYLISELSIIWNTNRLHYLTSGECVCVSRDMHLSGIPTYWYFRDGITGITCIRSPSLYRYFCLYRTSLVLLSAFQPTKTHSQHTHNITHPPTPLPGANAQTSVILT